tara:strand:+ start:2162 stop:3697 length:1536 start_codon:yes stop_codon:yes gene_type:complete
MKWIRCWFLAFLFGLPSPGWAESRPNILFIYTDDQSHRTLGCYRDDGAYPWVKTPHIDALASRGVRFTHAYIGTWCMPSRATMLTGHHPYGIKSMRGEFLYPRSTYDPEECPFWPKVFRSSGYFTAQIGKWHTGTDSGFGRDWDYQVVWNRPRYIANAGAYYKAQQLEFDGGRAKKVSAYPADYYTDLAVEFIRGDTRSRSKPWFLWLCYGSTHGPFTPAKRHLDAYPGVTVPIPADIYAPRSGKPAYVRELNTWLPGKTGQPEMKNYHSPTVRGKPIHGPTLSGWVRQYQQCVSALDEAVGRITTELQNTGQLDNTLVVFTSDQGFAWGQHGFCHKLAPYDANLRAPLIFSQPGSLPQGRVCRTPVGGVDLIPTFFAKAGIPLPWAMHGHDLSPLLANPSSQSWKHPVLLAMTGRRFGSETAVIPNDRKLRIKGVPWWVSLTQGSHKYIRTLETGEIEELYNLSDDPEELENLALKPEFAARVQTMRAATLAELRRTGAPFVDQLPPVAK